VITRALGTDPDVDVDTSTVDARPGDVFLLCSDGLTDMIGDDEIVATLTNRTSLDDATRELVHRANKAGGQDNITVIAFELTDEPEQDETVVALEETREHTLPPATPVPVEERSAFRRFLPLLILLGAIAAAAIVLFFLARR